MNFTIEEAGTVVKPLPVEEKVTILIKEISKIMGGIHPEFEFSLCCRLADGLKKIESLEVAAS